MSELARFMGAAFPTKASLARVGYAIPLTWHILIGHDFTGSTPSTKYASYAGLVAVFLAVAVMFCARPGRHLDDGWIRPAALAMCALPVWTYLPFDDETALVVLTFIGEAGCALMMVAWLTLYARLSLWAGTACIALSYTISSAFELALSPGNLDAALPAIVAVASLAGPQAFGLARRDADGRPENRDDPDLSMASMGTTPMRVLLITLAEVVACGFVLSALQGFGADVRRVDAAANVIASLLKAVFPILLLTPAFGRGRDGGEAPVAQATILAMAALLAGIALLGERYALVAAVLIMVGRSVVQVFSVLVIVEIARNARKLPAEASVSLGRGAYTLAMLGGAVSGQALGAFDGGRLPALNTLFFILACTAMVLTLAVSRTPFAGGYPRGRIAQGGEPGGAGPGTGMPADGQDGGGAEGRPTAPGQRVADGPGASGASAAAGIAGLAAEHGLTEREAQVLELLAAGNGVARIAGTLTVSENTVRYHCKNIYAKLGVHSRQGLVDLVNGR